MRSIVNIVRRGLDRLQRRWTTARPGTVLIMVVVVLVLLALIGTAYISTARVDRASSAQNGANVQVEMLVQGVENMVVGTIVQAVYDSNSTGKYRPAGTPSAPSPTYAGYHHWDGYDTNTQGFSVPNEMWLGARLPIRPSELGGTDKTIQWTSVTYPLIPNGAGPYILNPPNTPPDGNLYQFESPFFSPASGTAGPQLPGPLDLPKPVGGFQPTFYTSPAGVDYPALTWVDASNKTHTVVAADTDGDGIADAGLWKLPVGVINGVTYYAAVRIIDNGSAVNPNTAWGDDSNNDGATGLNYSTFFPSSINLHDLVVTDSGNDEMDLKDTVVGTTVTQAGGINPYRFNMALHNTPIYWKKTANFGKPESDASVARSDFTWISGGDILWNQLGRRVDNPGKIGSSAVISMQAFDYGDASALAYRFCLRNASSDANIEQRLPVSTGNNFIRTSDNPYNVRDTANWYIDNFGNTAFLNGANTAVNGKPFPVRALLSPHNPVSNAIPVIPADVLQAILQRSPNLANGPTTMPAFGNQPVKTSLNTASVGELWRAFWQTMMDDRDPTKVPDEGMVSGSDQGIFRSPIRDANRDNNNPVVTPGVQNPPSVPGFYLDGYNEMLLRAALAAANVTELRGSNYVVSNRNADPAKSPVNKQFQIALTAGSTAGATQANVTVFGLTPQPFITEVFVQTDNGINNLPKAATKANPVGYIAVELYNPYPFAISLKGCKLAVASRQTGDFTSGLNYNSSLLTLLSAAVSNSANSANSPANPVLIPPQGYLVLENYNAAGGGTALYRPSSSQLAATGKIDYPIGVHTATTYFAYVKDLDKAYGKELVLVRPWNAVTTVTYKTPKTTYTNCLEYQTGGGEPSGDLSQWVPLDQYDFSNLPAPVAAAPGPGPAGPAPTYYIWHYVRPNGPGNEWRFVYPGRYHANQTTIGQPRQDGTDHVSWQDPVKDPWLTAPTGGAPPVALGDADGIPGTTFGTSRVIQLNVPGWGGRNLINTTVTATVLNKFPFGGFARVGDVLEAPFIGAYRIAIPGDKVIEFNSVTMDCAFADDRDDNDDSSATTPPLVENVGRFFPVGDPSSTNAKSIKANDFLPASQAYTQNGNTSTTLYRYHWAMKVFDYFTTVAHPSNDFFPDVDPGYDAVTAKLVYPLNPVPIAVQNASLTANSGEEQVGVNGLININTAPWKVIAAIPIVPNNAGGTDWGKTATVARAIVLYRDIDDGTGIPHGPFKSIWELYQVPAFMNAAFAIAPSVNNGEYYGDLGDVNTKLPGNAGTFVAYTNQVPAGTDWIAASLMLRRISNFVTLRSDTFTVYLQVQGWRDAGTTNASLVVQRRAAFIVDRSAVTAKNKAVSVYNVPVN